MRIGFIVPTESETANFNVYNKHVSCVDMERRKSSRVFRSGNIDF